MLLGSTTAAFSEVKQVLDDADRLQADWQTFLGELDYADYRFYYFLGKDHRKMKQDND